MRRIPVPLVPVTLVVLIPPLIEMLAWDGSNTRLAAVAEVAFAELAVIAGLVTAGILRPRRKLCPASPRPPDECAAMTVVVRVGAATNEAYAGSTHETSFETRRN